MTLLHAIILGFVEGLTELLPVSSTGHLLVVSTILGIPETEFVKTFLISIQLGAIVAVCIYYVRRILGSRTIWKKIIAAFIPTAAIGFILYGVVKNILLESLPIVGWALLIGGIVMIAIEYWVGKKDIPSEGSINAISYRQAVVLGCVQALALIPGVSRSGATILGGLVMKIPRAAIVEFSFILAVPVIVAAAGFDLLKTGVSGFSVHEVAVLVVGAVIAGLVTWGVIVAFMRFIKKHTFMIFGWYRIVTGLLILIFVARM